MHSSVEISSSDRAPPRSKGASLALKSAYISKAKPLLTAGTGMDAFAHCLEAYASPSYHPMAEGIAMISPKPEAVPTAR